MESWEVVARESIRATLARYNAAGDRGRLDELAACFTADGRLWFSKTEYAEGRDGIASTLTELSTRARSATARKFVHHHVAALDIEFVSPSEATVRSYFQVLTDRGLDHWGRYDDTVVPVEGHWLIKERHARTDGRADGSWADAAGG